MPNQHKFKAAHFAPDGVYVTDATGSDSIQEVENYIDNMGSRWYFYPFPFVISETTGKVRSCNTAFPECKNMTIEQVSQHIKLNEEYCYAMLNS